MLGASKKRWGSSSPHIIPSFSAVTFMYCIITYYLGHNITTRTNTNTKHSILLKENDVNVNVKLAKKASTVCYITCNSWFQ